MTRLEVIARYDVDSNGIIRSLGKFEAEPIYVPHYWESGLDGSADFDESNVYGFIVSPEDRIEFPELTRDDIKIVMLEESESGFVNSDLTRDALPESGELEDDQDADDQDADDQDADDQDADDQDADDQDADDQDADDQDADDQDADDQDADDQDADDQDADDQDADDQDADDQDADDQDADDQDADDQDADDQDADDQDADDRIKCDSCQACMINGTFCHETGCSNARKTWDGDRQAWILYVECRECGSNVEVGETCDCQTSNDETEVE